MGAEFFTAPNPPLGAVFTYYLKNGVKSQQAIRREREIEIEQAGGNTPYPAWDAVRAEDQEEDPAVYLMVRDSDGNIVRQVAGEAEEGLHRSAWDLRLPPPDPVDLEDTGDRPYWELPPVGPLALPGEYTARLAVQIDGVLEEVGASQGFTVKSLEASPEITDDRRALQAFHLKAADMQRAVTGTVSAIAELEVRIAHIRAAIVQTPAVSEAERVVLREIAARLADISVAINGDSVVTSRNEPAPMSIASRAQALYSGLVFSQSAVAGLYKESYQIAASEFSAALASLRLLEADLGALEKSLEVKGAPWTPGRIPDWSID
jgi:hypothetical protein